ncbi:MAG: LPS assembly lipoprotein LptE [Alphaproteobacteria bacterium]|jgi:LPS-assembly lipoprotein
MRAFAHAFTGVAALVLAGCGFRPLYGEIGNQPGSQARFASVYVPPIELEDAGYRLRNDLLDILQAKGTPQDALYDLRVDLRDRNQAIAIQNETVNTIKEVEITRYNYTLIADYQLIDRKTQKVVTKGMESSLSAYDVVPSPYATLVAQQDAQAKTALDIAHQLQLRLAIFFAQSPSK